MNTFKRIILSVKSQIDSAADQFENHEALADVAIDELKKLGADNAIQLRHVRHKLQLLEERSADLSGQAQKWETRAIQVAKEDKEKALECVKRLQTTRMQIQDTERQLSKFRNIEIKISDAIKLIQEKIDDLKQKKTLLAARQQQVRTQTALNEQPERTIEELSSVFDRWEDTLVAGEFQSQDVSMQEDALTEEFERQEQRMDLENMLESLIQEHTGQNPEVGDTL